MTWDDDYGDMILSEGWKKLLYDTRWNKHMYKRLGKPLTEEARNKGLEVIRKNKTPKVYKLGKRKK